MENKEIVEKLKGEQELIELEIQNIEINLSVHKQALEATKKLIAFYSKDDSPFLPHGYEPPIEYPKSGTWKEKVLFLLKSFSRGMTSSEIVNESFIQEPNDSTTEQVTKNVSQALWSLKKEGLIDHVGKNYSIKTN